MARSDVFTDPYGNTFTPHVSLDRYQELMRVIPVAAFNGLYREQDSRFDCSSIWQQTDLDQLAENLKLAQEMREKELGFPLTPTYIEEEYPYSNPLILSKKKLLKIGLKTITDIDTLEITDYSADTVTLTTTVSFTDPSELHIYYPGETVEIRPKSVRISGGLATIVLYKARLLKPEYLENYNPFDADEQLMYDNTALYLEEVDVKRVYYAENGGIQLVWDAGYCGEVNDVTQSAKGIILNRRLGTIDLKAATYSSETAYTFVKPTKYIKPNRIRIKYVAGADPDATNELLTARLAHIQPMNLSVCEICWRDDVMPHPSKVTTPYGFSVAAVAAWYADSRYKIGHGGMFGGKRV